MAPRKKKPQKPTNQNPQDDGGDDNEPQPAPQPPQKPAPAPEPPKANPITTTVSYGGFTSTSDDPFKALGIAVGSAAAFGAAGYLGKGLVERFGPQISQRFHEGLEDFELPTFNIKIGKHTINFRQPPPAKKSKQKPTNVEEEPKKPEITIISSKPLGQAYALQKVPEKFKTPPELVPLPGRDSVTINVPRPSYASDIQARNTPFDVQVPVSTAPQYHQNPITGLAEPIKATTPQQPPKPTQVEEQVKLPSTTQIFKVRQKKYTVEDQLRDQELKKQQQFEENQKRIKSEQQQLQEKRQAELQKLQQQKDTLQQKLVEAKHTKQTEKLKEQISKANQQLTDIQQKVEIQPPPAVPPPPEPAKPLPEPPKKIITPLDEPTAISNIIFTPMNPVNQTARPAQPATPVEETPKPVKMEGVKKAPAKEITPASGTTAIKDTKMPEAKPPKKTNAVLDIVSGIQKGKITIQPTHELIPEKPPPTPAVTETPLFTSIFGKRTQAATEPGPSFMNEEVNPEMYGESFKRPRLNPLIE